MRSLRRSLTTRGAAFAGCGTVLVASGILLGQRDVTRIGVLLLALVAISLVLVRRHGLRLEVRRTAAPSRVAIDERAVVSVTVRNVESSTSPVVMAEESIDYALGDRPALRHPGAAAGHLAGRRSTPSARTPAASTGSARWRSASATRSA